MAINQVLPCSPGRGRLPIGAQVTRGWPPLPDPNQVLKTAPSRNVLPSAAGWEPEVCAGDRINECNA